MPSGAEPDRAGDSSVISGEPGAPHRLRRRILLGLCAVFVIALLGFALVLELRKSSDVAKSLGEISPWWLAAVALGSVALVVMTTATTAAPLPELSFTDALVAQHASQATGNLIPGPSAMAVRYAILRSYGVGAEDFARATVTVAMLSTLMLTTMPLVGILALTLAHQDSSDVSSLLPVAIIAALLSVASIAGVVAMLWSPRFTAAAGRVWTRMLNWFRRRFHRKQGSVEAGGESAIQGRLRLIAGLRDSGWRVLGFVAALYWANGLLLVICLWAAGVPTAALGLIVGLAVYTLGRLSTLVQVTPGGIGVVEVAYTAAFTAYLGGRYQAQVLSGVILYRAGTYLLPILVGAVCGAYWWLTRHRRERESGTIGDGATGGASAG